MKQKRDYPLEVLNELEQVYEKYKDVVIVTNWDGGLIEMTEKGGTHGYYFQIVKYLNMGGGNEYEFIMYPSDRTVVTNKQYRQPLKGVFDYVNLWLDIMKEYNQPHPLFDEDETDPILKAYISEIEEFFDMHPEDSDNRPYGILEQNNISRYTEQIIKIAEANKTEKNAAQLDDIISEAESIKEDLGKSTKGEIKARFKKLYAKSLKVSVELLKEIAKNVIVEVAKDFLTGGKLLQLLSS